MKRGLLIDDDALYLRTLKRSLERRDFVVTTASTGDEALAMARAGQPEFVLLDLKLLSESGLDLIKPLRAACPDAYIVLVTGYASIATAVEAMKRGADHYLAKPVTANAIARALLGETIEPDALDPAMTPLSRVEWEHIQQAMVDTDGNVSAAARLLGMHRRTLQRKLAKRPISSNQES
ncbi:two-component system response regulator [Ahniella affigens]|uniref:Two-component system response regulator n=1 Tax=Ahniella affigens TaxID=2021234 RepID=A0A2P1PR24_9GAMM|nr:response regulator transcription factor [Ahniella affigens]AVP97284.1 two-component system response regulator [Ahniella affigens]